VSKRSALEELERKAYERVPQSLDELLPFDPAAVFPGDNEAGILVSLEQTSPDALEQAILDAVRHLSADQRREMLNYAARLRNAAPRKKPFKSVKGLWADLTVSLSAAEIDENQREMWSGFPRDGV
jgi:hypothetical protein